jgi:nucleotidyltransferase/DNA polymerase involved in DNA repair
MKQGIVRNLASCPICGIDRENILHILWSCPSVMDVWGVGGKKKKKKIRKALVEDDIL